MIAAGILLTVTTLGAGVWTPRAASGPMLLGVSDGRQGWDVARLHALDQWLGRPHDVVVMFTNWDPAADVLDNLFERQLPALWTHGAVPMITWEPTLGDGTPPDIVSRAADGEFDRYFDRWARRLRSFLAGDDGRMGTDDDRRVYLRPAHEMNGDWYGWGQRAPARFVAMWRRVHRVFGDLGLGPSHVQWVWCVTNTDHGPFPAEAYFPGDEWIDWVGVDGYNWGVTTPTTTWREARDLFTPMLTRLRAISSRPLALVEVGSTRHGGWGDTPDAKNTWIRNFFTWLPSSGVRMVAWFNMDREADFAVFGGEAGDETVGEPPAHLRAFSAYREAAGRLPVQINPANPRRLTDALFRGH